jgi:hypothetical protein
VLSNGQIDVLAVLGLLTPPSVDKPDRVVPRPGASVWQLPTGDFPFLVVRHLEAWLVVTPAGGVTQSLQCLSCHFRDWHALDSEPARTTCTRCERVTQHRHVAPGGEVWA